MPNRRDFLTTTMGAGLGLAVTPMPGLAETPAPSANTLTRSDSGSKARSPKRILILGGTGFIGPQMVHYAVDRGHDVTIFTRGRTEADIPDVERLIGDRNDDLSALEGRTWDVVLDNNSRDYRWVERSTELLKDAAEQYIIVSSISAYDPSAWESIAGPVQTEAVVDETWPLHHGPHP